MLLFKDPFDGRERETGQGGRKNFTRESSLKRLVQYDDDDAQKPLLEIRMKEMLERGKGKETLKTLTT